MSSTKPNPRGIQKPFPVLFCGVPIFSKNYDLFFENTKKNQDLSPEQIIVTSQVTEKIKGHPYGVVILLIPNKTELVNVLNTVQALKERMISGAIRVIAYNLMNNEKINLFLKKQGVHEIVNDSVAQKALTHKLLKHIQIVSSIYGQSPNTADEFKALSSPSARPHTQQPQIQVLWSPGVEDPNDCWILREGAEFKYLQSAWIGEMIGPGPSIGYWHDLAEEPTPEGYFRWTARNPEAEAQFFTSQGHWYFYGRKPEFQWNINCWRFVGSLPKLFFRTQKGSISFYRIKSSAPARIEITRDSALAKSRESEILQTFNQDRSFNSSDPNAKKNGENDPIDLITRTRGATQEGSLNDLTQSGPLFSDRAQSKKSNLSRIALELGLPTEEWEEGVAAFEELQMECQLIRTLSASSSPILDVNFLENEGTSLLLDTVPQDFSLQEALQIKIFMSFGSKHQNLNLMGKILRIDVTRSGRAILRIEVEKSTLPELREIQSVFDQRQKRLTEFLEEAKGFLE